MPISLDEENALEKVARNTYEDNWLADGISKLRADRATLKHALEIIAGKSQCLDNLMGNRDVAERALAYLDNAYENVRLND